MSERRVLRDRAALYQKSNPLNTEKGSVKNKSKGKENCLLQDLKNNDNVNAKKIINSLKSKSLCDYKQKRKAARRNSTTKIKVCSMKENNHLNKRNDSTLFVKETSSESANVHNRKQNMPSKVFTVSKSYKPSTESNEFKKNTILNSVNSFSKKDLCKPKTDTKNVSDTNKIPIYFQASKPCKKSQCTDIYDITLDEDFVSSRVQVKKEKIKPTRNKQKENRSKKLCNSPSVKISKSKKIKLPTVNSIASKTPSKNNPIFPSELGNIKRDKLCSSQTVLSNETECVNEVNIEQNGAEDIFSLPSPSNGNALVDLQSCDSKNENKTYLSNLAEEFEKSFSIPRMTSTPEGTHLKTVQSQKNKVVNLANISDIPSNSKNCLNTTMATPVISDDVLPEIDKDVREITLFESPMKPEAKKQKNEMLSPKKPVQINLFGSIPCTPSPSSEDSLEDTILMPKKAYNSPDNFKISLIRTKKPVPKTKKEFKKSRQDLLIEKLSQHFDEIENTELCIE